MSADWENEIKSVAKVEDKWEGEDSDDEVKDNWDDEDEAEPAPETDAAPKPVQISAKKKKMQKIAEKERKEKEEKLNSRTQKTPEELLAEKLERQRILEEADLILAKEAFGGSDSGHTVGGSGLDISLNTKEDFESFKKSLVDKLLIYDKSPHFVNFLENMFRELCVSIESEDIKRLSSSLTALFNEKVKAQKAGTKGKKKGKGFSVRVERNDIESGLGNNDLEEFDDFI